MIHVILGSLHVVDLWSFWCSNFDFHEFSWLLDTCTNNLIMALNIINDETCLYSITDDTLRYLYHLLSNRSKLLFELGKLATCYLTMLPWNRSPSWLGEDFLPFYCCIVNTGVTWDNCTFSCLNCFTQSNEPAIYISATAQTNHFMSLGLEYPLVQMIEKYRLGIRDKENLKV